MNKTITIITVFLFLSVTLFSQVNDSTKKSEKEILKEFQNNMILVKGGQFYMGCTGEQISDCSDSEKPYHKVEVSSFSLSKYEVTQELYSEVMGNNPSSEKNCSHCPVEQVSWQDAQSFITKLNALTGKRYRLPTESEWEYAARGGDKSLEFKFPGSNNIDEIAWYDSNSNNTTHPVGQKRANENGLYDMAGNVWELCSDWYDANYYAGMPYIDPKGPTDGTMRVIRGGAWSYEVMDCRVSSRFYFEPKDRDVNIGFRLALDN